MQKNGVCRVKGILWLLSGFNKKEWLDINLNFLVPFLDARPHDKLVVVSNGENITDLVGGIKNRPSLQKKIDFVQLSFNRAEGSQMDYGAIDIFHMCNYYAKIYDNDNVSHVVNLHWDILLYHPERIIELCQTIEEQDKDIALYYRKVNIDLREDVCPHGWLLVMKKELMTKQDLWFTLPLYKNDGWGIERALRHWLINYYQTNEIYPEHKKIINLGTIDYYTKEFTHVHFHDINKVYTALINQT